MRTQPSHLIVNLSPTGIVPTKAMTAHMPVGASEIVDDVLEACGAPITMVHVRVRDERTGNLTP
jgi:uncharacterized protein (DUF849 family)